MQPSSRCCSNDPESRCTDRSAGGAGFAQGWNGIDPTETVTMGLNLLAEARKVPLSERERISSKWRFIKRLLTTRRTWIKIPATHMQGIRSRKAGHGTGTQRSLRPGRAWRLRSRCSQSRDTNTDMIHERKCTESNRVWNSRGKTPRPDKPILRNNLGAFYLFQAELERTGDRTSSHLAGRKRSAAIGTARHPNFQLTRKPGRAATE